VDYIPAEESAAQLARIQPLRQELRSLLPSLLEADDTTRELLASQINDVSDTQLIALTCQILELTADRKQRILEAPTVVDRFLMVYENVFRHMDVNPEFDDIDEGQLN
jgi:hypothetical protein